MTPSLQLLGAGATHTEHWRHFNHAPEVKPWVRAGSKPSATVRGIVKRYMGEGFPVETIEWGILEAIEAHASLGVEKGMLSYLAFIGREGRLVLAAIKRNYDKRPELWAKAVS